MGPIDLLLHLANFAAPAFAVAVMVAFLSPIVLRNRPVARILLRYAAINFAAGLLVLVAGLWWSGRDGRLSTYAVLVLAVATSQWLAARAWRG